MRYIFSILIISAYMFACCADGNDDVFEPLDLRMRELTPVSMVATALQRSTKFKDGVVEDSNLSRRAQRHILKCLKRIYASYDTPKERGEKLRDMLKIMFPYTCPNVVVNFDAIMYYQRWYICICIYGDRIFAFGL